MNSLYTDLSEIYEGMYQTFINYEEEFSFYAALIKRYKCHSVLEAGCGTGNLAHRFAVHFDYTGLDLSDDMLSIAKRNNSGCKFVKGDMRDFSLAQPVQSCIISGRSISYLAGDQEVRDAIFSIQKNLTEPGLLSFDFIDAAKFIPSIEDGKNVTHEAIVRGKRYKRESFWKVSSRQRGVFDWHSVFYEEHEGNSQKMGEDYSTIRAFWTDEMTDFINTGGFKVEEIISRPSYAFDTMVMVATKAPGR